MSQLVSLEGAVLLSYALCLTVILVFSLGQYHLLHLARRSAPRPPEPPAPSSALPRVTVQLPVYNERHVIRRLIDVIAALDYPRELLEIQVLDDSTDDTTTIAAEAIGRLRGEGLDIRHVVRPAQVGFKAGALAYGLERAGGELVAIFDADFLPAPDFLRRTVPHFVDPSVGAVQARWVYFNEAESALTRVQSFLLGLHFCLEQPARYRNGLFLNFNGTAGVLRRSAITDAGGWSADTLTEDIDLSYRAQLRGWRIVYLDEYVCPSELPAEIGGLRSQQYRWMKGGAQNARRHLRTVVGSTLPGIVRFHAALHLLAGSIYVVIFTTILLSVALATLKNTSIASDYVDYGLPFLASTLALFAVFRGTQRPVPAGWGGHLRFIGAMLAFLVFTMGLSVHNSRAVVSGWLGRRSAFVRTPKFGAQAWSASSYVRRSIDRSVLLELLMLAILAGALTAGWYRREFALYPIQLMAASGLVWVTVLSLVHPMLARRRARRATAVESIGQNGLTKEITS